LYRQENRLRELKLLTSKYWSKDPNLLKLIPIFFSQYFSNHYGKRGRKRVVLQEFSDYVGKKVWL
jgi:hypothetical protein